MTQLNELRLINDSTILYLKTIKRSCKRNEIIKNILDDESCFFKMNKDDAYIVLKDIGVSEEQLDSTYQNLISTDEFYRLYENSKIDLEDDEVLIKYPIYNTDDIFKKTEQSTQSNSTEQKNSVTEYKQSIFTRLVNKIKTLFSK